jgi:MoCo/4Fe-4S cofactor protein with predicted Tat translocation signal
MEKKYWKGVEELRDDEEFVRLKNNEFYEHLPVDEVLGKKAESTESTSRRDFLKFMGFGMVAASLAACEAPVKKAIPYIIKPEEITPGVPNYYASTFSDGHDYSSILVKTREGRPIKIDGNKLSSISNGATNARVQASVLSLYDDARYKNPTILASDAKWNKIDENLNAKFAELSAQGKQIRLLTSTITSPSTKALISEFVDALPGTKHVTYDAVSFSGMRKANEQSFGKGVIPAYDLSGADVVVGVGCDFMNSWLSPVEHSRQYAENRKLFDKKNMSRHFQIESTLSVTGSNADHRYRVRPSKMGDALTSLYNHIASKAGASTVTTGKTSIDKGIALAADNLWKAKGKAVVLCGVNDPNMQLVTNAINTLLGSYDSIIDIDNHSNLRQGNDDEMNALIDEMASGKVDALIIHNCNPVYTWNDSKAVTDAIKKVFLVVATSDRPDESAELAGYICPSHHYLESWDDAEPVKGSYSLAQPVIKPLFDTRQMQDSLIKWGGLEHNDYYSYLQSWWKNNLYGSQTEVTSAGTFWNTYLQKGVYETGGTAEKTALVFNGDVNSAASAITGKSTKGIDIVLYEKAGLGNGNQANNPWLQELPDPISRICWDNYVAMAPSMAAELGLEKGNMVEVSANGTTTKGPVCIQPGVAENTVAIAIGYGRRVAGKTADGLGFNAYPLATLENGAVVMHALAGSVAKTSDPDYLLAGIQTHHTMMGRAIVKETNLDKYLKDPKAGNPDVMIETHEGKKKATDVDLWATPKEPGHDKPNHFWGMSIDLNACNGCGSCVISCQVENNVPVVGKSEINISREMHWIRIDRYYSSDMTEEKAHEEGIGKLDMLHQMEDPSDSPDVVFQPVMCQHCNHAPCETVCPVVATTHSSEGLNMMAYNRCVGTRYCANNCPYKVRRYNWWKYFDNNQFDYNMNSDLGKMVLNPDVTVRSRGVMEKCSMCVQKIQYGKLEAKKAGRRPIDGEINTACADACPTNAIIFGDYNDSKSKLSQLKTDERTYHLLEELNVQPSIYYHTKVRNKDTNSGSV